MEQPSEGIGSKQSSQVKEQRDKRNSLLKQYGYKWNSQVNWNKETNKNDKAKYLYNTNEYMGNNPCEVF